MRTASSMWSCVIKRDEKNDDYLGSMWFTSCEQIICNYHWMTIMLPYWCPHNRAYCLEVYKSVGNMRMNYDEQVETMGSDDGFIPTSYHTSCIKNMQWLKDLPMQACFVPFRATSRSNNATFCESKATFDLMSGRRTLVIFVWCPSLLCPFGCRYCCRVVVVWRLAFGLCVAVCVCCVGLDLSTNCI